MLRSVIAMDGCGGGGGADGAGGADDGGADDGVDISKKREDNL